MLDTSVVGQLNVQDPQTLLAIKRTADEIITYRQTRQAWELAAALEQRAASQPVSPAFSDLILELKLVALPLQSENRTADFLGRNIVRLLKLPQADIAERLRIRLVGLPIAARKSLKAKILSALRANAERITSAALTAAPAGGGSDATVGNWTAVLETVPPTDAAAYLRDAPDVRGLPADEQALVTRLLYLVTKLATPSESPEGIEEDLVVKDASGAMQVFSAGELVGITAEEPAGQEPKAAPMEMPKATASFSFTPEDEEEIRRHAETLGSDSQQSTKGYEALIDRLITQFAIPVSDDLLRRRLTTILLSRFKGVRDAETVKDLLTRPVKIGGMGFAPALADQLLLAVNARSEKPLVAAAPSPPPRPRIPAPPIPYAPPPLPAPAQAFTPKPVFWRPPPQPTRRHMTDIRKPSRLTSPTDELAGLTPEEFRRLGGDTVGSINKVYEKLQLLSQESFGRRVEGIHAWRRSPVYRLYLELGEESMNSSKSIADVIQLRAAQGKPYLETKEFMAIADLNKQLRL